MLQKVIEQRFTKLFYVTEDGNLTYDVIVEDYPEYVDSCIYVDDSHTIHVEITDLKRKFKRNIEYQSKTFSLDQLVCKSRKYFSSLHSNSLSILHKVFEQRITKLFYVTEDSKYTYDVIVEDYPEYVDPCISVVDSHIIHVEITDLKTKLKRTFDFESNRLSLKQLVCKSQIYFNQFGLIPNPRLSFIKHKYYGLQ